jgi:hypothetical protein
MLRFLPLCLVLAVSLNSAFAQEQPAPRVNTEIPFAITDDAPEGGFGTQTWGGLEGRVIKVTNLDDSGKGSLRMAVEALKGPRTVVFEVSGQINLQRDIVIRDPFATIAGQTVPSPGITVAKAMLRITTHE